MKVQRLEDGAHGWAIQMAGTFVLDGRRYPGRSYLVAIGAKRFVLGPQEFIARFNSAARTAPPELRAHDVRRTA